ncbi:MAG: hypothetical protein ACPG7F_09965, partial [Aggregatilineales bacterium]
MELIIGIVYIGVLLFVANRQIVMGKREALLNPMLYGLALMMVLFFFGGVMFISSPDLLDEGMTVNPLLAGLFLVVGSIFTGLTLLLIQNPTIRSQIMSYLPGEQFKHSSPVHLVALILMLMAGGIILLVLLERGNQKYSLAWVMVVPVMSIFLL